MNWRNYWNFDHEEQCANECTPLQSSRHLGRGEGEFVVIDQFGGRVPYLTKHLTISSGTLHIGPVPPTSGSSIPRLDSNIVGYVAQYVFNRADMPPDIRHGTEELPTFSANTGFGFDYYFYQLEAIAKSPERNEQFKQDMGRSLGSLIQVDVMDRKRFLSDRAVLTDPKALELLYGEEGTNVEEIATGKIRDLFDRYEMEPFEAAVKAIYSCLLKMALIHRASKKGVVKKFTELHEFMLSRLNMWMGRESACSLPTLLRILG